MKYNISGTDTELINEGQSITIKKDYSDDANAKNDITESDVLVELLKNNKLFYDNNSTKYVFNKVDLSGMKYCCFLSKYTYNGYDIIYCLKCALNLRSYHNTLDDFKDSMLDYCGYCSIKSNACGDIETYYDIQRNILDTAVGGYQNRIHDSYTDAKDKELCTRKDLKKGWKTSTQ